MVVVATWQHGNMGNIWRDRGYVPDAGWTT